MKLTHQKNLIDISKEWDEVCLKRVESIEANQDFSLINVNIPCIINHLPYCNIENILEVGCGIGYLSNILSERCNQVIGIDISRKSIEFARNTYHNNNLQFEITSIQDYKPTIKIHTCIANMVLMTDPNIVQSLNAIYNIIEKNGSFLFTITHPCFWPKYWGYDIAPWFDYNNEIFIENEFSTSQNKNLGITTHIHRPLNFYFNLINETGFTIEKIIEPYPIKELPQNYSYSYPRFLFMLCAKK